VRELKTTDYRLKANQMTKYILNSGAASKYPEKDAAFIKEILSSLKNKKGPVKVLYCFFAQPREHWEEKFQSYQENFSQLAQQAYPGIKLEFDLAFPDQFEKQVQTSNAIIIPGGDDYLLQFWLKQFDLPKLWNGKVVAGSSAGSDALVSTFWTCDWRKCMEGLGILPIKFIPHFNSSSYNNNPRGPVDWQAAYQELQAYGDPTLPIYAPEEGDFVVINQ
jgi:peptidase E